MEEVITDPDFKSDAQLMRESRDITLEINDRLSQWLKLYNNPDLPMDEKRPIEFYSERIKFLTEILISIWRELDRRIEE